MENLFDRSDESGTSRDGPAADVVRQIEALRREIASARAPSSSKPASGQPEEPMGGPENEVTAERVARSIGRLRACRARRARDPSIAPLVSALRDATDRTHRRLGALIDLWEELVPPELVRHTKLSSFRGGVLHVSADSSPVAYEVDRLLRAGLTAELRRRFRGTLARVRVRIGGAA